MNQTKRGGARRSHDRRISLAEKAADGEERGGKLAAGIVLEGGGGWTAEGDGAPGQSSSTVRPTVQCPHGFLQAG